MLRLITGKAKTGKTARIYREIRERVGQKRAGAVLIVPEQYSHEAERELCRACGDALSLYAEVVSFTAFARHVAAEVGGIAVPYLDKGGKQLCMALAARHAESRLELFRSAAHRPELQTALLALNDRLKTACVSPEELLRASEQCGEELGKKLRDLALLAESYDAVVGQAQADPADRLSVLAAQIPESTLGARSAVYVDGFLDFTNAELAVLNALMKQGVELTVCLTLDSLSGNNEIFALSRSSARKLLAAAKELGVPAELLPTEAPAPEARSPLSLFADELFSYSETTAEASGSIELWKTDSPMAECEFAAAEALRLVRETGCRWRDIAIAVRGFSSYSAALESVFEEYGVPLFTAEKVSLASRPLPSLIRSAYAILAKGWREDDVLSYMDTGLTGLTRQECDDLSEYISRWQLSDRAWHSSAPWRQHPDGYGKDPTQGSEQRLSRLNALRRAIASPLLALEEACSCAETATQHALALAGFLEQLRLPELLAQKAEELRACADEAAAEEYRQLWEVTVRALEQVSAVLGDAPMKTDEFSRLFLSTLCSYDVGRIPASLDAVTAGDLDRMRRRNLRFLLVLGASDDRLPAAAEENGFFSDDELRTLDALGAGIGEHPDVEMWREYALIYQCVSLPSERLIFCCPQTDASGALQRPSMVVTRAQKLFRLPVEVCAPRRSRLASVRPALRLAASGEGKEGAAARAYFHETDPDGLTALQAAASGVRGRLSPESVEALYGKSFRISASRADRFYACRLAYFYSYGLRLKKHAPAEFDASQIGTFTHYVLENTAREVREAGGFQTVDESFVSDAAESYIRRYEQEKLNGLAEKSPRFRYLLRRSEQDIRNVALDMAGELKRSKFVPLAFELDFGKADRFPPVRLGSGEDELRIAGIADRVDGWETEGKVYLRVDDYKTGTKKFSLSDIWYGLSMQMVLYLYALHSGGDRTVEQLGLPCGAALLPAGVEYIPARDPYVSAKTGDGPEEIEKKRHADLRRSGIMLADAGLLSAWETESPALYAPAKAGADGELKGEAFVTEEQFELLYAHIQKRLTDMAAELRKGSIEADPYERSPGDRPCAYCDYAERCGFADGENGEDLRPEPPQKAEAIWEKMRKEAEEHDTV